MSINSYHANLPSPRFAHRNCSVDYKIAWETCDYTKTWQYALYTLATYQAFVMTDGLLSSSFAEVIGSFAITDCLAMHTLQLWMLMYRYISTMLVNDIFHAICAGIAVGCVHAIMLLMGLTKYNYAARFLRDNWNPKKSITRDEANTMMLI